MNVGDWILRLRNALVSHGLEDTTRISFQDKAGTFLKPPDVLVEMGNSPGNTCLRVTFPDLEPGKAPTNECFYMVCNSQQGGTIKFKHADRNQAVAECERIAAKNPSVKIYLMQAVEVFETRPNPVDSRKLY